MKLSTTECTPKFYTTFLLHTLRRLQKKGLPGLILNSKVTILIWVRYEQLTITLVFLTFESRQDHGDRVGHHITCKYLLDVVTISYIKKKSPPLPLPYSRRQRTPYPEGVSETKESTLQSHVMTHTLKSQSITKDPLRETNQKIRNLRQRPKPGEIGRSYP